MIMILSYIALGIAAICGLPWLFILWWSSKHDNISDITLEDDSDKWEPL